MESYADDTEMMGNDISQRCRTNFRINFGFFPLGGARRSNKVAYRNCNGKLPSGVWPMKVRTRAKVELKRGLEVSMSSQSLIIFRARKRRSDNYFHLIVKFTSLWSHDTLYQHELIIKSFAGFGFEIKIKFKIKM